MIGLNLNVTAETVKVLANIQRQSLYGSAPLRTIQENESLGLTAGEVSKAVTAGRRAGVFAVEDYTLTRTYTRGRRTITEEIPTKLVRITDAGSNLLTVLQLVYSGDEKTVADMFRNELNARIDAANALAA